jgi:hypothetical protein
VRTEQELRAALQRAAAHVDDPADLAHAVRIRHRRRARRRYQSALAFAGVVAVVAGGSAVVRGADHGNVASPIGSPATARASEAPSPVRPGKGIPARDVWPGAVSTIPAKSADGSSYSPVAALSPTELLLGAGKSFERTDRLDVYNTETGKSRELTRMPFTGKEYFQQRFEVGEDYIGWYSTTPNNNDRSADFWVAPRRGGHAVKVGEVTGDLSEVYSIGVTKDFFVWSVLSGGVYRMPIAGGSPERLQGTDGLWLQSWPWAADVSSNRGIVAIQDRNQTLLVNLETGEKRTIAVPSGVRGLRCSTEWCVGRSGDKVLTMRPDGSKLTWPPAQARPYDMLIFASRFAQIPGPGLYDLDSGKTARIGSTKADGGGNTYSFGGTSSPATVFSWPAGDGKLEVLNLLAVDG